MGLNGGTILYSPTYEITWRDALRKRSPSHEAVLRRHTWGGTRKSGAEEWAVFDNGGIQFCLHAIPTALAQEIDIATPPELREEVAVKLMFEVNDLEAERERLESFGAQIIRRPWQNAAEALDAVDPEGNIFQIFASGLSL